MKLKPFLFAFLAQLFSLTATAYDAEIDGIYYDFSGTQATVVSGDVPYSGAVTIPSSVNYNGKTYEVTEIGEYAFMGCSVSSVNFPHSLTSIGEGSFFGCSGLISVDIPNSVTSIGYNAFSGTPWYRNQPEGLIYAGKVAYEYKGTMPENTSIELREGTLGIAEGAFSGCRGLISISIPESVINIGSSAFNDCSGLTSITIPEGVTSIGNYTFSYCSGLTSITIPEGVTSIGDEAFAFTDLTTITIPENVISIGKYSFHGCNLSSVRVKKESPITILYWTFIYHSDAILYVPKGSKAAYQSADYWKDFREIIECDYVDVPEQLILAGSSTTLEIEVNNFDTDIVAFQMDLTPPVGVSIDKTGCSLSSRITDEEQELNIGTLENGAYRLTSSSHSLTPISGNDGTLLTLKLTAAEGSVGGQATISNIRFSTSNSNSVTMDDEKFDIKVMYKVIYTVDGEAYKTDSVAYNAQLTHETEPNKEGYTFSGWSELPETMPAHNVEVTGSFTINQYKLTYIVDDMEYKSYEIDYASAITPEAEPTKDGYTFGGWSEQIDTMPAYDVEVTGRFYLYGDVNTDEAVDVVDVIDIARFVVATPSKKFREKLSDLNFDSFVNIGDAVTLVNYIAGNQNFVKEMFAPEQNTFADALSLTKNGKAVALNLINERAYTAFQFDLYVPEDANIVKMMLNNQRKQNHQLLYNKVEDGHYRVAALSTSNNTFHGTEGELLSFVMDDEIGAEVEISNIHFFDTRSNDYTLDVIGIRQETGVNTLQGIEISGAIYDLQGRKLSKMQRGVNIVDGKKYILK